MVDKLNINKDEIGVSNLTTDYLTFYVLGNDGNTFYVLDVNETERIAIH